jgi:hypothetical protein
MAGYRADNDAPTSDGHAHGSGGGALDADGVHCGDLEEPVTGSQIADHIGQHADSVYADRLRHCGRTRTVVDDVTR